MDKIMDKTIDNQTNEIIDTSTESFKSDFSSLSKKTTEESLTQLVAIQQKLKDEYNSEKYECNKWYKYYRPRFQAVGQEINKLRETLPFIDDKAEIPIKFDRNVEKLKSTFADTVDEIKLADFFVGENPTKELPDPYQNFNDYTEVDPGSDFTIGDGSSTGSKISVVDLPKNITSYIYKDFDTDHFETFEHKLQTKITEMNSASSGGCWGVGNALSDIKTNRDNNEECLYVFFYEYNSVHNLYLYDTTDGTTDGTYDAWTPMTDIDYFMTVDRDGATLTLYVRTGSHTGTLVDTLSITISSTTKYRYMFPVSSYHLTYNGTITYTMQDLDIQESINVQLNVSDVWKDAESVQINIGDAWKDVVSMQINIGDSWKTIF